MTNGKGASGAANAQAPQSFQNARYGRSISHPVKIPHHKTCGHARATVRNVVELDGVASYICRACFAHLLAVEVRVIAVDRVRRKLAELFRHFCPRAACGLGGAIEALVAMMASIGEGRASVR